MFAGNRQFQDQRVHVILDEIKTAGDNHVFSKLDVYFQQRWPGPCLAAGKLIQGHHFDVSRFRLANRVIDFDQGTPIQVIRHKKFNATALVAQRRLDDIMAFQCTLIELALVLFVARHHWIDQHVMRIRVDLRSGPRPNSGR